MPKSKKRATIATSKTRVGKKRVARKAGRPVKPTPKIPAGFEEIAEAILRPERAGDAGKED
jgi:hypothetical protein